MEMSKMEIDKLMQQILLERMQHEYDEFIDGLTMKPVEDIIDAAYEKVSKEDILIAVETGNLSPGQVRALLREGYPLDGCYQRWLEEDINHMEDLILCVEDYAKSLMRNKDKEFER